MNKNLLKAEMIANGDNNATLAMVLGITPQRFSAKINCYRGADFTQHELKIIKDRYKLNAQKMENIFFENKVS